MSKKRRYSAFQRSRRRIVAVIMTVFLLLFTMTLVAIYMMSYRELYQENLDMLEVYVEQYRQNGNPSQAEHPEEGPPMEEAQPDRNGDRYLRTFFYSVAFNEELQPFSVDVGNGTLYTEEELAVLASQLLENNISQGTWNNFVYCIDEGSGYTLVALMDNTLVADSFTTLFRNALLAGAVMVLLLAVCAVLLARWIIRPLEESDRRQRQFISDAGHELKTPVSVIEANAELLEREIGENQWLRNIRQESGRMAWLVKELLALARTEEVAPQMEMLNLGRLVLGGVLPFESRAFEAGRELDCRIEENIEICGNAGQLSQLVSILMDNALGHSEGEGDISIQLSRPKAGAVLTVSNPGFIPEQDRKEIFDRFFRGDVERGNTGHCGLGLSIAKSIVAEHRGEIDVDCSDGRVYFTVRFQ